MVMKKTIIKTACLVMAAAALLLFASCADIPNEDKLVEVTMSVAVANPSPDVSGDGPTGVDDTMTAAGTIIDPPPQPRYHLKISISNPAEEFLVFNYVPGSQISLMVTSGEGKVVDVEGYDVPSGTAPVNTFTANNYITLIPEAERTVDLSGEPVELEIFLDMNFINDLSTNNVNVEDSFSVSAWRIGCPSYQGMKANVTDLSWGITFPTVDLDPYTIPYFNFHVQQVPVNRTVMVEMFHEVTGHSGTIIVDVTDGASITVPDINLLGYEPPYIEINNGQAINLVAGDSVPLPLEPMKGLGSFGTVTLSGASLPPYQDTCFGSVIGNTYTIWADLYLDGCTISVEAFDNCEGGVIRGTATVNIYPDLSNCGDGSCDDFVGESNSNCPSDCYCGDGYCNFDDGEDQFNCIADCAALP